MTNIFCIEPDTGRITTIITFCFKNKVVKRLEFIDSYFEDDAWDQLMRKYGDINGWLLQNLEL